jgi:hypothetical protein
LNAQNIELINSGTKCIHIIHEFGGGGGKECLGVGAKALGFLYAGLSGGRAGSA